MQENVVQPEIRTLVEGRDFAALKAALIEMEVHDLAELLAQLEGDDLPSASASCRRTGPWTSWPNSSPSNRKNC